MSLSLSLSLSLRLSGVSPFFLDNAQAALERIKEARYDFYSTQFEHISQEAKDFISALLQKNPEYVFFLSVQWAQLVSVNNV